MIIDYGHNPSAVAALIEAVETFPHQRRRSSSRPRETVATRTSSGRGELLGEAFDTVILYEYANLRGRPEGEIWPCFARDSSTGTRVAEIIDTPASRRPIEPRPPGDRAGDLLVIQPKEIDDVIRERSGYLAETADGPSPYAGPAVHRQGADLRGEVATELIQPEGYTDPADDARDRCADSQKMSIQLTLLRNR